MKFPLYEIKGILFPGFKLMSYLHRTFFCQSFSVDDLGFLIELPLLTGRFTLDSDSAIPSN